MNVLNYREPFWHTIIENYYTPEEETLIWQEIEFLSVGDKLLAPELTGDPRAENKTGCILRDVYKDLNFSSINKINQKLITQEVIGLLQRNPYSKYLTIDSVNIVSQIQYYLNDGKYNQHQDSSTLSAVCLFYKQPKRFTGGEFMFGDYRVPLKHNTLILFPSCEWHKVEPVKVSEEDILDGFSRYSICQFISI